MKQTLEFNNKRQCGLWLMVIGGVLILSVIFGGHFLVNPFIFLIGYYAAFFGINMNKKVREKLSEGSISKFQIKMIWFSIAALFVLMFFMAGFFIPGWNWRMIWLGVLMATALHFFLWFFIHGKSMIALGAVCVLIAGAGYLVPTIPLTAIYFSDAAAKILCGAYLFLLSKPSKFVPKSAQ